MWLIVLSVPYDAVAPMEGSSEIVVIKRKGANVFRIMDNANYLALSDNLTWEQLHGLAFSHLCLYVPSACLETLWDCHETFWGWIMALGHKTPSDDGLAPYEHWPPRIDYESDASATGILA